MKLTMILPAIGKKAGKKYIGTWKMEPLTIALLKSLIPPEVETVFFDDRIELIDYDSPTDLVLITVETYTARRSYQIAKTFREHGACVILGGYHATLVPEEAGRHADAVITGNAESVLVHALKDYQYGVLKHFYHGEPAYAGTGPDRSVFMGKSYLPVSLVETGRGCCNRCEFCAIAGYYKSRYYRRPIDPIITDIKGSGHKYHFLVDDNIVADKNHAMCLFKRITPLGIKWAGQGTLNMAKDPKMLKAMKKSGCEIILIGFESLDENNLRQMNKTINIAAGERDELVRRIHDAGIGIYATFVFGYDHDTEKTIEEALRFSERHRFYTAAFNHLLPFPGTPLYDRLKEENRLLYDRWWLEEGYRYGELAFQPKNMSPERLSQACRDARKEFSGFTNTMKRGLQAMGHASPAIWGLFWAMNLRIGGEVDLKMNVPIGENLDELPK